MEILINKIYRYNKLNVLTRIHEVKESDGVAYSPDLGTIELSHIKPALNKGQRFVYNGTSYKIVENYEYLDDTSVISAMDMETGEIKDIPFLGKSSTGRPVPNLEYLIANADEDDEEVKEPAPFQNEMESYIDSCYIPFSSNVINKIAKIAEENKKKLVSLLSKSEYWDEENLCINTIVDVHNPSSIESAEGVFDRIIDIYKHEYSNDYKRLIRCYDLMKLNIFMDVTAERAAEFKALGLHIAKGMKPSRAINKFFTETGMSRISNYEKLFAELSDYLTNNMIQRRITLSVNPMDFLRMSEGNSWKSCHLVRDHGCYSNGVFSYMMDEQSMVLSLLNPKSTEKPYLQKKINRMMFFINENNDILQSRLYPQTRIPAIEDFLANWVNEEISKCLKIENLYKVAIEDSTCASYVTSTGMHYRDYGCTNFGQRIFTPEGKEPEQFHIGHESYCVKCGSVNDRTGEIRCHNCENDSNTYLGFRINYFCPNTHRCFIDTSDAKFNEEDGHWYLKWYECRDCGKIFFDKHIYCEDCRGNHEVPICEECGEPIVGAVIEVDGKFYCEDCYDENFFVCDHCGKVERKTNRYCIEDTEEDLCETCYEKGEDDGIYFRCEDCGGYFSENSRTYVEGYGDVCNDCIDAYYYCDDCGCYYCSSDVIWVNDVDGYVCDDCRERYYVYCEHCEEYVRADNAQQIDGTWYCNYCVANYAHRCDHCGELYMGDDYSIVDDELLCPDCYDHITEACYECGEVHLRANMVEVDGEWYCEDCVPERDESEDEATESNSTQTSPDHLVFDNGREVTLTMSIDRFDEGTSAVVLSYDALSEQYVIQINTGDHTYYRSVGRDQIA